MLPHKHFIIAGVVITPAALVLSPSRSLADILYWVLTGGIMSAFIDTDVVALVLMRSGKDERLRPYRNPRRIFRQFKSFMQVMYETGTIKIAMTTHIFISAGIVLAFYIFKETLLIPVLLGVLSHLASDIPHYRTVLRG